MDDKGDAGSINYELLVEDSLRTVVKGALAIVEHAGLPGDSHFYITFRTTSDGVQMSDTLKAANPEEMTIVLQHQFWDLAVNETHFSVTLSFSGVHHNLNIPFSAVTHFTDPSVGFSLQFSHTDEEGVSSDSEKAATAPRASDDEQKSKPALIEGEMSKAISTSESASDTAPQKAETPSSDTHLEGAEIVSLDRFRKDPNPKN